MRAAILAAGIVLAAITPGAALLAVQQWTPAVLALSALAGSALAVAGAAYKKATANQKRLEVLARHIPKRSTDTSIGNAPSGVTAREQTATHASTAARTAISHPGEEVEP